MHVCMYMYARDLGAALALLLKTHAAICMYVCIYVCMYACMYMYAHAELILLF